jgi:hypothetical protein
VSTLRELTGQIREINVEKGWRAEKVTWGDLVALLHSEIGEMMDAWRRWGLLDATRPVGEMPPKPEGVGSETADVVIRFLDMCDLYPAVVEDTFLDFDLLDIAPQLPPLGAPSTFGGWNAWLNRQASKLYPSTADEPGLAASLHAVPFLRAVVAFAEDYNINLAAEVDRKIAYNRTRPYRHGGKRL